MERINYILSELEDMDKVIVFLRRDAEAACHTKKMIFRKEETNQYQAGEIFKIDGYLSRFDGDLKEDYLLLNVPDVWFWDVDRKHVQREEDFDLMFVPKDAVQAVNPALETMLKRLVKELKQEA